MELSWRLGFLPETLIIFHPIQTDVAFLSACLSNMQNQTGQNLAENDRESFTLMIGL